MEYRNLGKSGLKISCLSFGSWVTFVNQLTESTAMTCMSIAHEYGVNFFDNAEAYANGKSEILMGKIFKLNTPLAIVINLKGKGVKPAPSTIHMP